MVLIIIDGLDASGKSTQADLLIRHLKNIRKTYFLRSHPSDDNFFGKRAREYLFIKTKNAHIAASLFYLLDVIRSIILYSWRSADYIIFVRYLLGTAYLPAPLHKITFLFFSKTVPVSDNMFYLKVSPAEAFRRIVNNRIKIERFETLNELNKTSEKAMELITNSKWKIIEGDQPVKEIHKQIIKQIGLNNLK